MLWSQVGAIDLNPPGQEVQAEEARGWGVPPLPMLDIIDLVIVCRAINFDRVALCIGSIKRSQRKASREVGAECVSQRAKPYEHSTTDRPRSQGARVARFRRRWTFAGKIRSGNGAPDRRGTRRFEQLKIMTYTPEDQQEPRIDMSTSVLNLKTRVLSSKARTTIQRADFNIAGDSVEFDTNSRTGRLIGNVKMVITDKSHLTAKPDTKQ